MSCASQIKFSDFELLHDKYTKLLAHSSNLQHQNEALEGKLLYVVEKVEGEKLLLSCEIDHLADRLSRTSNLAENLKHECTRYKSDCKLAVQLLQCQPIYNTSANYLQLNDKIQNRIADIMAQDATSKETSYGQCTCCSNLSNSKEKCLKFAFHIAEEEAPPEPTVSSKKDDCSPVTISKNVNENFNAKTEFSPNNCQKFFLARCQHFNLFSEKINQSTQTEGHVSEIPRIPKINYLQASENCSTRRINSNPNFLAHHMERDESGLIIL